MHPFRCALLGGRRCDAVAHCRDLINEPRCQSCRTSVSVRPTSMAPCSATVLLRSPGQPGCASAGITCRTCAGLPMGSSGAASVLLQDALASSGQGLQTQSSTSTGSEPAALPAMTDQRPHQRPAPSRQSLDMHLSSLVCGAVMDQDGGSTLAPGRPQPSHHHRRGGFLAVRPLHLCQSFWLVSACLDLCMLQLRAGARVWTPMMS